MRVTRLALGLGAAMITSQALAGVAEAQKRKAPRIDLRTSLGSSVASNYIEPSVTLSEDAKRATLTLSTLRPGHVYELQLKNLAPSGAMFHPDQAHYTLNQIPAEKSPMTKHQ